MICDRSKLLPRARELAATLERPIRLWQPDPGEFAIPPPSRWNVWGRKGPDVGRRVPSRCRPGGGDRVTSRRARQQKPPNDAGGVARRNGRSPVDELPLTSTAPWRHGNPELDEIWSFVHAKNKTVKRGGTTDPEAGDCWTWIAFDPDTKLVPSRAVGDRTVGTARPSSRTWRRGSTRTVAGKPDMKLASTSGVERVNLTLRMGSHRFTRKTNAYSKKFKNHDLAVALQVLHYNFIREHETINTAPAVAAGIVPEPWTLEMVVDLLDAQRPKPNRPKYAKKAARVGSAASGL